MLNGYCGLIWFEESFGKDIDYLTEVKIPTLTQTQEQMHPYSFQFCVGYGVLPLALNIDYFGLLKINHVSSFPSAAVSV